MIATSPPATAPVPAAKEMEPDDDSLESPELILTDPEADDTAVPEPMATAPDETVERALEDSETSLSATSCNT
jgi:hypothetical protein